MEGAATENAAAAPAGAAAPEAAVDADQLVEGAVVEDPATPTVTPEADADADQVIEDASPEGAEHGDTEVHFDVLPEQVRSIIEVIADTGKFWHDWSFLKRLLSLQLKQVLAEYSEAQITNQEDGQQQRSLLGETYSELVSRLNDALLRFEEGPPFTLQRLCEILLDPKGTYTKLSKLALALEKNLLVTSTMTKCTDPYPFTHRGPLSLEGAQRTENIDDAHVVDAERLCVILPPGGVPHPAAHGGPLSSEGAQRTENVGAAGFVDVEPLSVIYPTGVILNGTEHAGGDGDEEMADAEAEEASCSRDVEMHEEKPDQVLGVNRDVNSGAAVATEAVPINEPSSDSQS